MTHSAPTRTTATVPSTPWALGDYQAFAEATVWQLGPVLAAGCGIGPGDRVLDVAAGTGNVALRAAAAGARVTASDITRESLATGRRLAARQGVELDWVEADAQALPFPDASFDVVTSLFGAMFAPDHRAVADELCRVCRPGGRIGLISFRPGGIVGEFFTVLAPHLPPPPAGAQPPPLWGDEDHLRALTGDRVEWHTLSRREYVERAEGGPAGYHRFVMDTFGPAVAARRAAARTPGGAEALDEEFLAFARRHDAGAPGGPAEYHYQYLLALGRRSAG